MVARLLRRFLRWLVNCLAYCIWRETCDRGRGRDE